jgi:hypothetical protein
MRTLLGSVPIGARDWAIVAGCSVFPFLAIEAQKVLARGGEPESTTPRPQYPILVEA